MVHIIEDETYVSAARRIHQDDGALEVDKDAKVSRAEGNPDKGAYVAAWVWVYDEDVVAGDLR